MVKLPLVLALLCLVGSTFCLHEKFYLKENHKVVEQWKEFLQTYKKSYTSFGEELARFQIFKQNLELIKWMQSKDTDAEYGVTKFADMTQEEFRTKVLIPPISGEELKKGMKQKVVEMTEPNPDKWDWRDYHAVSPVKNQGSCGSCWAFSTIGNIEGLHFIKTGKMVSLSAQQLVDCDKILDMGCHGGWPENAFRYIQMQGGLQADETYPYTGKYAGQCLYDASKAVGGLKVKSWEFFSSNEDEIAQGLVKAGPLTVGLDAFWLQFYRKGIHNPWFCSDAINHAVLMVGFGTDKKDFWSIKNSWAEDWGEDGYFRIIRGDGKCGINLYVMTGTLE